MNFRFWARIAALLLPGFATADPAQILDVQASQNGTDWRFSVTLVHGDTGWKDYADGWRVELADGTVLGTRVLFHPHVEEQPFTRSLGGVSIPAGTKDVFIRAKTLTEGWSEDRFKVRLK